MDYGSDYVALIFPRETLMWKETNPFEFWSKIVDDIVNNAFFKIVICSEIFYFGKKFQIVVAKLTECCFKMPLR